MPVPLTNEVVAGITGDEEAGENAEHAIIMNTTLLRELQDKGETDAGE